MIAWVSMVMSGLGVRKCVSGCGHMPSCVCDIVVVPSHGDMRPWLQVTVHGRLCIGLYLWVAVIVHMVVCVAV